MGRLSCLGRVFRLRLELVGELAGGVALRHGRRKRVLRGLQLLGSFLFGLPLTGRGLLLLRHHDCVGTIE